MKIVAGHPQFFAVVCLLLALRVFPSLKIPVSLSSESERADNEIAVHPDANDSKTTVKIIRDCSVLFPLRSISYVLLIYFLHIYCVRL